MNNKGTLDQSFIYKCRTVNAQGLPLGMDRFHSVTNATVSRVVFQILHRDTAQLYAGFMAFRRSAASCLDDQLQ